MTRTVTLGSVELDTEKYESWQKTVIYEKKYFQDQQSSAAIERQQDAARHQAELVAAVDAGPEAVETFIVRGVLNIGDLQTARSVVPELPNPLTSGEMTNLPAHAEFELARVLNDVMAPAIAVQPTVWALCHAVWTGRGVFGADLPAVFFHGPKAGTQEARVRNFLRRTGGLRRVRANTSPLVDCPISAACWRVRLAQQAADHSEGGLTFAHAHGLLRQSEVWQNVVGMSLRQVTALCAQRGRSAALVGLSNVDGPGTKPTRQQVQAVMRALGRLSYSHGLDAVPLGVLVDAAVEAMLLADDAPDFADEDPDDEDS